MQVITRITSIGATLIFMSGAIIPYEGWGLWVIGALIVVALAAFILSMIYAVKLNEMFDSMIQKISAKFKKEK